MKILRSVSLLFALLAPVAAIAAPDARGACCPSPCCEDGCPLCPC